ncbi:glyoxalase [Agromyces rhizosphaerae]|uniref:Glyoxalase n=1 Tax=Agromyces rhizosphaerae TaxID=88374 RepID=A0A9W6FNL2_9MICO|nr:VOC family protein [Agromyces rhizosphaerae]GLI26550.1 glyoxalase [Agromyces rhizosphaerae]
MPLPGLRGSDHIGITVPDLDQADDFFVRVLGAERFYDLGPFAFEEGDWMAEHLAVHPRTVMRRLRFYRLGHGVNFEVFEYESADEYRPAPRNSDVGGHHVALYVDDLDAAVAYLRAEGVRVLGEPTTSRNASEGQRWVYFLSPWGMQFELVSFPDGKAYERGLDRLLWHPARPAE